MRQHRDMVGWLVRLGLVGLVAAAVDIGWLLSLDRAQVPLVIANVIAVGDAALVSYALHRLFTFADNTYVRWIHEPTVYIAVVVLGLGWDLLALGIGLSMGLSLLTAKLVAVATGALLRTGAYWWVLSRGVRQRSFDPQPGRTPATGAVRLSVVVPAYREEGRIADTVALLRSTLAPIHLDGGVEIVVVDDGSPDDTAGAAERAGADVVVRQPANRGKGAAVRAGMLAANGATIAFTDADLAYSPDQILTLLERIEDGWDMVAGSRHHQNTMTVVQARRLREVGSRLVNLCTMALLLGVYRDTQCGLKAFRADAAQQVFGRARVDGFAFDVELFHLADRLELSVLEVPVRVENSAQSTVNVARDAARLVRDVLRIRRWDRQGVYIRAS